LTTWTRIIPEVVIEMLKKDLKLIYKSKAVGYWLPPLMNRDGEKF